MNLCRYFGKNLYRVRGRNFRQVDIIDMNDCLSVNLGSVYESVVASELRAHCSGPRFYYDNKAHGEVEFLLDDYDHAAILPVEVKIRTTTSVQAAILYFSIPAESCR